MCNSVFIGVFVEGKKWQFSDFPQTTPAEIFDDYVAVHVDYDDAIANENVSKWKLNRFQVRVACCVVH
jgi:hypothetical protein